MVVVSVFSSPGALAGVTTMVSGLANPVLSVRPGQSVTLRMRFDAEPMSEDYGVFLHLVDGSGNLAINGGDHAPPQPTSTWSGAIGYDHTVSIPVTAAPGQYSIRVGLSQTHSPWDRAELAAGDGVTVDDQLRYTVATLTISDPSPTNRDPLKWPFDKTSIWNMPIGSGAVYAPANLPQTPGGDSWAPMPQIDDERIVLKPSDCYRWPATAADSYAVGFYGTEGNNANSAMKMGALLAIPASVDLSDLQLETAPAKQLAWTLQNYGAYIVDDTYGASFALNAEDGPDGSVRDQFRADWGFDLEQRVNANTPWTRDMQRLVGALNVVDNNSPDRIGGGGAPRQPLAPDFE